MIFYTRNNLDTLKKTCADIKNGNYQVKPDINFKNQQLRVNALGNVYIVESTKKPYSWKKIHRMINARR